MILVFAFLLILIASYSLYLISSKQIAKTQKSKLSVLAQHVKLVKVISFALIILALFLFSLNYGNSISFVALCILSSPILFGLILFVNDLKSKIKK